MIDKSSSRVRAMFSDIAGRYDTLNHLLSGNQDKRWRRRAIRLLSPRRGERVLDLCCGTGDLALQCRTSQPGCEVVGADFALPMLELAHEKSGASTRANAEREKENARGDKKIEAVKRDTDAKRDDKKGETAKRDGETRGGAARKPARGALPLIAADALRLPFADESFDAAMVAFGARNFQDTAAGLREMRRVTKRGGRILVLEFMRPTSPLLRVGFGLFFKNVLPIIGRVVSQHESAYNYLPASVDDFYTRDEFVVLLRRSGFHNVRALDFSGGIATCFLARRPVT